VIRGLKEGVQRGGDRFLVVIFTRRDNLIRVISARNMNRRERKYYDEKE